MTPVTYPKVAALDAPNTLISIGKQSIQRSSDVGCSWQQIDKVPDDLSTYDVAAGAGEATLFNGNKMWRSPIDPDLLYFSYGTSFGGYGSDLYRFRPSTGELTWQHNRHDGIPSLAFNRADPSVLYLRLAEER
ncbi:MAG TPA: hypothetical protein VGD71_20340 [Kribbella sp.]